MSLHRDPFGNDLSRDHAIIAGIVHLATILFHARPLTCFLIYPKRGVTCVLPRACVCHANRRRRVLMKYFPTLNPMNEVG